jgi:hypothetical protein
MGQALLRAYQVTGNRRWFDAAKHWGDLLAAHCNLDPNTDPWPRYANPETARWKDNKQTGGVTMILAFLDELIRLGYTGKDAQLLKARDAGVRYVRDRLLPAWTVDDTWARYFWDWPNPTQNCSTTATRAGSGIGAATRATYSPFSSTTAAQPRSRAAMSSTVHGLIPNPAPAAGDRSGMHR